MQPQFTLRVLGIRSWTLFLEFHQFCMSHPPQRAHNMGNSPFLSITASVRLAPGDPSLDVIILPMTGAN
ncbi:MAG: hypothetical protein K0S45_3679 [Nitrospira sp.]|jgi:hypothetical protein|nr:hypothetical protein [Nitrospira sp.]